MGVMGAGQMGASIAEVSARAGVDVLAYEPTEALTTAGRNRIVKSVDRGARAGSITAREGGAAAPSNPGRVLGLHFFNPVPVLPLVELVSTLLTGEAAAARTEEFASAVLGKQVVRCSDRSGFVVNALLVPYLLSAIRMVETGFATVDDVDKAVVAGLSHPMGPLRLSDLIGLDTLKLIADKLYEEFKEPHYGPPPLLLRMVEAGLLGKKSGQGFYTY